MKLTLFLVVVVGLALVVLVIGLLRAAAMAEQAWLGEDDQQTEDRELRGRLIASQQRFRRQADWSKPAAKGVKGDAA